ncbi:hypothetical protein M569_13687 [Genlisea aurea]|uniref:Uncharacterized protein n=1 Tax=Genlisea aurea TaxID=192259 RepID=S8C2T3_9LAMI|nr:hypothetical protein M569_13687 [Genlisea aurea]
MISGETSKSPSSSPASASENGVRTAEEASFRSNTEESQHRPSSPETQSMYDGGDEEDGSQTPQWSMLSASPDISTLKSPIGYDPNRIPSSIFNKAAADWSIASNESLFSIHIGKSGELFRLDDSHFVPYTCDGKSGELLGSSSVALPPLMEVSANEENSAKSSSLSRNGSYDALIAPPENQRSKKMTADFVELENRRPSRSSSHRLSVESVNSAISFAFPVLVQSGSKTGGSKKESPGKQEEKVDKQEHRHQEQRKEEDTCCRRSSMKRWLSWFSCWPSGRCCC